MTEHDGIENNAEYEEENCCTGNDELEEGYTGEELEEILANGYSGYYSDGFVNFVRLVLYILLSLGALKIFLHVDSFSIGWWLCMPFLILGIPLYILIFLLIVIFSILKFFFFTTRCL